MLDMCGPGDEITAATGADALDALVQGSPTNGQTAALAGAMAALLHSMGAHPLSYDVQHRCCLALKDICTVSLLALTNLRTAASEARPLLSAVKVNHPRGGGGYAKDFAEDLWAKMQQ